ncbi:MAG: alpha/beta fold hydrolase [Acidimicrobiales bacterium]
MSAPPVLLLHGFATSADRTWRENGWIDLLSEAGREVLALDLLGHGNADKPHDPEAYEALEQLVVDALPDEPVDAIGFSLGSRTILAIACRHPERFNRIIVSGVGDNLFRRDEERGKKIAEAIAGKPDVTNPEAYHFNMLADSPEIDRQALTALLKRKHAWPITDEGLAKLTQPVLVVLGDQDFAGPPDPLLDRLPNAKLVVLRRCDHFATPKDFKFIDSAMQFLEAV